MIRQALKDFLVGTWIIFKVILWFLLVTVVGFGGTGVLIYLIGIKVLTLTLLAIIFLLGAYGLGEAKRKGTL